MHGVHHQLQCRIDNRPGFFGIEAFNQRRRAFEIGKQRRDGLALPVGDTAASSALVPHGCVRRDAEASSGLES